jgi:hypothetical protein
MKATTATPTADEIRELTPSVYEAEGCGTRLGEASTADHWMRFLALRASVAIAGHLDRTATVLEGDAVDDLDATGSGADLEVRNRLIGAVYRARRAGAPVELSVDDAVALLNCVVRADVGETGGAEEDRT